MGAVCFWDFVTILWQNFLIRIVIQRVGVVPVATGEPIMMHLF